jgi:hypothetical protein
MRERQIGRAHAGAIVCGIAARRDVSGEDLFIRRIVLPLDGVASLRLK